MECAQSASLVMQWIVRVFWFVLFAFYAWLCIKTFLVRLECYSAAVADLSRYLEMRSQTGDAKKIRETLRVLWQLESRLN